MPVPFPRTLRALERDRARLRGPAGAALVAVLLAWSAWVAAAPVSLVEVSSTARLETRTPAHPVAIEVDGRVVASTLELDRDVRAGELLVELDHTEQDLGLRAIAAEREGLERRRTALEQEVSAVARTAEAQRLADDTAVELARARRQDRERDAALLEQRLATSESLAERGLLSGDDLRDQRAAAETARAAVAAQDLATLQAEQERSVHELESHEQLASLERLRRELDDEVNRLESAAADFERERARRFVVAPIAGRIGDCLPSPPGTVVELGDVLGHVVPDDSPLRLVAEFPASSAGRLAEGQVATVRFDGFDWTRFGALRARLVHVGREARSARLRVECELEQDPAPRFPLRHGATAVALVEVEHASPAALALRRIGRLLGARPVPEARDEARAGDPAER